MDSAHPLRIERRGGRSFVAEQIRENYRARHEPQRAAPGWPTAEESAKKWGEYLRDVDRLGEARAAEIHLQRSPAAGHDRDYDFGL